MSDLSKKESEMGRDLDAGEEVFSGSHQGQGHDLTFFFLLFFWGGGTHDLSVAGHCGTVCFVSL